MYTMDVAIFSCWLRPQINSNQTQSNEYDRAKYDSNPTNTKGDRMRQESAVAKMWRKTEAAVAPGKDLDCDCFTQIGTQAGVVPIFCSAAIQPFSANLVRVCTIYRNLHC